MKSKNISIIATAILVIFLITACTPTENITEDLAGKAMETPAIEEVVGPSQTGEPEESGMAAPTDEVDDIDEEAVETPAWFDFPMVDVRTGLPFTINDHQGKVVLVEMLAMWCPTCLKQQTEVKALHERLSGEDRFVSIGLDIDINEQAQDLKTYTENNQFDWIYAIAPVEVAREISGLYGAQFLNPPSTPILVIDMNGEVHLMNFGIKSVDELYDFVAPLLYQ